MRAPGFSSLTSLTLLALLAAARLSAQEAASQPAAGESLVEGQPFVDSIDVQVVNLEVFVTDRQGKRVGGLARDDFEVLEDGRPIQVSNFYAVAGGRSEIPETGSVMLLAGETEGASETLPLEQQLNLAIVIDDLSLDARNRNQLLLAIGNAVLPRLRPDDRVLVGLLSGSRVRIAQRLTSDPGQLRTTLEQISRTAPAGIARLAEKRDLVRQIEGINLVQEGSNAEADYQKRQLHEGIVKEINVSLQDYTKRRAQDTRTSLKALTQFIESLAGLPGRKAVLYAGGGLSLRPGEALFQAWEQKFLAMDSRILDKAAGSRFEGMREDLTDEFQQLVARANANRVTFYNLGITEEVTGVSAEAGGHHAWVSNLEGLEKMNIGESLNLLAGGTGGLAGVDLSDPRNMLERMREDFDSFYSLGYVPEKGEARNRKIEVRVRGRNDLTVRHREGRRDPTNKERMTGRTLSALILDPGANPLDVEIEILAEARKPEKENYLVEALVKFPLSRLVLLPGERFHEGRVTLFLGAQDSQGRLSPIQEIRVPIQVPVDNPGALAQTAAYKATLELRPEAHRIAVSLRDELGNTDSAVVTDYTPGVKK